MFMTVTKATATGQKLLQSAVSLTVHTWRSYVFTRILDAYIAATFTSFGSSYFTLATWYYPGSPHTVASLGKPSSSEVDWGIDTAFIHVLCNPFLHNNNCAVFTADAITYCSSMWRNFRPYPSIWRNFTSHRALQERHTSHTVKSTKTFLTV